MNVPIVWLVQLPVHIQMEKLKRIGSQLLLEVFSEALAQRATAIIVAHNHPSGILEPSVEDREVTRRLKKAGDILGIPILDHLVFSEDGFISMLEGSMF